MLSRKVVLVPLERVGELVMLEAVREYEPAAIARVGIEIGEHLVHAAVLRIEHPRHLLVAHGREHALRPRRELRLDVERRLVARISIGVAKPGVRLVQGVPRRPEPVQVEAAGTNVTARYGGPRLTPSFERAEI